MNKLYKTSQIKGYIGHFGLADWWLETFTEEEKLYIVSRFRQYHPRSGSHSLLEGDVYIPESSTRPFTASSYLNFLISIFRKTDENTIARKFAKKSLETATNLHDLDEALKWTIRRNYKARHTIPETFDPVVTACYHHIELAPEIAKLHKAEYPLLALGEHEGYTQLVKILEKQHKYADVLQLAQKAKAEGWQGDWDTRIERCERRIKSIAQ